MLTIVWDRDDVLNDLMRCWFEGQWLVEHPDCRLRYDDLVENPPHRVLGVSRREYLDSLDRFRSSPAHAAMPPSPEILGWLGRNGARCRHAVLTATTLASAGGAAEWTFRHFGRWVRCFCLLPAAREGDGAVAYEADKGQCLRQFAGPVVLVDDSPANLEAARREGAEGVLFPRPWNGAEGTALEALACLEEWLDKHASP
jgi:hypothetical protein